MFTSSRADAQDRIQTAMVDLLARAGLDYRGGYVEAAGQRIHYLDYSPTHRVPGSPLETVLLLHGGGAGGPIWFRQIAALSQHFRVIAPDNPLFGLSSQTVIPSPIQDFTTAYLRGFLDALGLDRVMIAGLSAGGAAGMWFAVRHPERVSRLCVLDSAGLGRELPFVFKMMTIPGPAQVFSKPGPRLMKNFFSRMESASPEGPDAEAYLHYCFSVTRVKGHSRAVTRTLPAYTGLDGQRSVLTDDELSSVQAQTLIIWGARDRFFPVAHARRAHRLIPGSILHILPEAGHVATWDAPETVNGLLKGFFKEGG